jgi:chromosome partitioning protein
MPQKHASGSGLGSLPLSVRKGLCLTFNDLGQLMRQSPEDVLADFNRLGSSLKLSAGIPPASVKKYLLKKGFLYPQKVVSLQMLKGGVAKTTSALNIGLRASMYGFRVLFVDLDQQANLSFALGEQSEKSLAWIDLLERKADIHGVIRQLWPGVDLIPSNLNNSVLDRFLLSHARNWSSSVERPLAEIKSDYDLIIIDTAPSLSMLNTAVTLASDEVLLPINPDRFSLIGAQKHLQDLQDIEQEFHIEVKKRVLFTKFDSRESLSHIMLEKTMEMFPEYLMEHYIRASSEIRNVIGSQKSIFSGQARAGGLVRAKEDYDLVTRELVGFPTGGAVDAVDQRIQREKEI